MKHKDKIKLARKMMSREEIKEHTPIFQSKAWNERVISKANKRKKKKSNHLED